MSNNPPLRLLFFMLIGASAIHCADEALQTHGGYGYIDEYKVQRLYRDAKVLEIHEGTKEMELITAVINSGLT